MFKDIIRKKYWFLPTKDEQKKYKQDFKNACKKEIPEIEKKIKNLNEKARMYEDKIMQSEQAENFLKLKSIHQTIIFNHGRLEHHYKESKGQ